MAKLYQSADFIAGRKEGRNEALQLLLNEDAETFEQEFLESHAIGDTGDYGVNWVYDKLVKLFDADSDESILDRLDDAFWEHCTEILGLQSKIEELERKLAKKSAV